MPLRPWALGFVLLAAAPAVEAQGRAPDGFARFAVVREAGGAVTAARIGWDDRGVPRTTAPGRVEAFAPGRRSVQVTAPGYAARVVPFDVQASDTTEVLVTLVPSPLTLQAVTVTALPVVAPLADVASPVSVLDARDVERSLGNTLAATLANEPGVTMRSQGPAAAMPIIRGLTGERIVVLQDGQRTADLAASAPDHGVTIDPLAARGVELVRGPAALLYGSNALGGVVNVTSDDIPRVVPASRLSSVAVTSTTGARGAATLLDVTQPLGSTVAVVARLGGRSHDDQRIGGGATLLNTSARNRSAVLGIGRVAGASAVGVAWRRHAFEYGLPYRDGDDPAGSVRLRGGRHEVSGRAVGMGAGPVAQWRVEGTAQWYEHDEVFAAGDLGTTLGVNTRQLQAVATTRATGTLGPGAIAASWLMRDHGVDGPQALTPPGQVMQGGLVAFQEWRPRTGGGRLRLPLAGRLERSTVRSRSTESFGPAVVRDFTTWSASGGALVGIGRGAGLALTVARAARVPGLEELFSRAGHAGTGAFEIGNPSLAPETTRGLDLVARLDRPGGRLQAAAWATRVQGWIGMYPTGRDTTVVVSGVDKSLPLFRIAQRPARLAGLELLAERVVRRHLVLGLTADALRSRDGDGGALPFMPPGRIAGSVRWEGPTMQWGASVRQHGAQRQVTADEATIDGFTLVDAHVGVRHLQGETVHSLMLRLDNAADRLTRDATSRARDYAPNPGRSLSFVYRVTF